MRIGIDAHFVGMRHGGNEFHFENLITHLSRIARNGDEYFVFTHKLAARDRLASANLTLLPLTRRSVMWQRGIEIPYLSRKLDLDVLHVPFNVMPVFRCKKVVTIHDLAFLRFPEAYAPLERARMTVLTRASANWADHILTVSEAAKRDIVERYGASDARVTVAPNAVDREVFRSVSTAAAQAFRRAFKLDFDYILFVGALLPRKNIPTLLKAYEILTSGGRFDHHLVLVGRRSWYSDEVLRLIADGNLTGRVHHFDAVDVPTLVKFYSAASLLVYPSLYEGFGMPILEAMSCGCPVVSSNTSSMPEVYGDAALAFDPNQPEELAAQLDRALGDAACREELVRRGFRNCARFSWERSAALVEAVYHAL